LPRSINQFINQILCGDARQVLQQFPDESIDCVVTSPPYWALRDYGVKGQLGLEPSFQDYIAKLCDVFDEVKRVLKRTGTCWVNLGDTYYSIHAGGNNGLVNAEGVKQRTLSEPRLLAGCCQTNVFAKSPRALLSE
jgi:DNA modification methylase